MDEQALLQKVFELFVAEGRLIEVHPHPRPLSPRRERGGRGVRGLEVTGGRVVFVGDTHGDLEASQIVVERYLDAETTLVFLGDYVDRGPSSLENILFLLEQKLRHPKNIILLQGNHEGWKFGGFSPADFWEGLDEDRRRTFAEVLAQLPWMVSTPTGVLAAHAGLPDIHTLREIHEIEPGSERWRAITWGDWQELPGYYLGDWGGRPQYGEAYFREIMRRVEKKILIRGHQPQAPRYLFGKRCLTLFTSSAYPVPRMVALLDLDQPVEKADQLMLELI